MLYVKNAKIKTMVGTDIENGQIIVENGKIKAIGENLKKPKGAEVIDAGKNLLTPGLIDAHCHVGLFGEAVRWEGADGNEIADPITPQLRGIDSINPFDDAFKEAIAGGVTSVGTGPGSANIMGGTFAAVKCVGKRVDDMAIKPEFAMKIAFGENPKNCYGQSQKKSPITRMAIAAGLREMLFKAQRYTEELDEYEKSNKKDKKRPAFDMKLHSLVPVMRKQMPLKAHAHRADDILTSIRIANEFGLDISLEHCTDGHLIVDELVKENKPIIVGPTFGSRTKPEVKNKTFDTVKILVDAGLKVAINTDAPVIPIGGLSLCAGMAIAAGLDEQKGWECITKNPAEIMGIADRVGTLEVGKDADFVIFSGNPLTDIDAKVLYTVVDGEIVYSA